MSTREEKNREIHEEIENDELREKRKRRTIICLKIILVIMIFFILFFLYTKYISTKGLIIKEKRIVNDKLPTSFHGVKVIHLSDLYYGSTINIEEIQEIVKKINEKKPDIIVFTGDLIDQNQKLNTEESEKLIQELSKLSASIGMYAVTGDQDQDDFNTILKQSGFVVLDNSSDLVYNNDFYPIQIIGLSSIQKQRNIEKAFSYFREENKDKEIYTILLLHEADSLDEILTKYPVDLALAGNSLNGQICLTNNYCLIKKEGSTKYFKEYYKVKNTELYISSGIGSPSPYFRFMARPSINFFRLARKNF